MFQQVVRWTFIVTIWKRYKGQLLTIIGYLASLWLVSLVHDDYLEYVAAAGEGSQTVGTSFAAKWLAYAVFTGFFYWVFQRVSKSGERGHKGLGFLSKFKGFGRNDTQASEGTGVWQDSIKPGTKATDSIKPKTQNEDIESNSDGATDPFANIRKKKVLRSEADLIFELKEQNPKKKKGA